MLKNQTRGWSAHIIDILAVLATLFGLAAPLGHRAQQTAAGINHAFGTTSGVVMQIVIIGFTALDIASIVRGLDGGLKVLSNINMLLA